MSDPSSYPQDEEGPFEADWDGLEEEEGGEEGAGGGGADATAPDEEERIDPPGSARRGLTD